MTLKDKHMKPIVGREKIEPLSEVLEKKRAQQTSAMSARIRQLIADNEELMKRLGDR